MKTINKIDKYFANVIGIDNNTKLVEEEINAKDLIVSNRIDLIAKLKYIESIDKNINTSFYKDLYKETLSCFSDGTFMEPGNKNKNSFDSYIKSFNKMIKDIKINGFDNNKSIIPVSLNNVIYDGSHRVAICAYYNKKINITKINHKDINYDLNYFKNKYLDLVYLDYLCLEYCKLKKDIHLICIWPSCSMKIQKDISNKIYDKFKVVYEKDVSFNYNGLKKFMIQVYKNEKWIGNINNKYKGINTKVNNCIGSNSTKFIIIEEKDNGKIKKFKEEIRKDIGLGNHSIHTTDSKNDNLLNTILNSNTINFFNKANMYKYKDVYKKIDKLKDRNIDTNNILIDGSTILSLYGLRDSNDIDLLVKDKSLSKYFDIHNNELYLYDKELDDILYNPNNYIYFEGLKYISLDLLKYKKEKRREKKDVEDVELINSVLSKNKVNILFIIKRFIITFLRKIKFYIIKFLEFIHLYNILRNIKRKIKKGF